MKGIIKMSKKKNKKSKEFKKIPISEFISDKKLETIEKILQKSSDVDLNYDRVEELLEKNYTVKDLGTNRLVLIHKDKKYKNLIFKVAGDSHGIEANYREFFNGDLDKNLTFSYSISKNGVFIVQERVERMTFDIMKDRKKDVRKMLKSLSKKLLLVDCKLSNFKNFGIRKNGDVCLLDHGDTVPLPNYQGDNIVNLNEESYVSLKCKKMANPMAKKAKDIRPCGGKLKYNKDFEYFICNKCGAISPIHDAYKEFYGDKRLEKEGKETSMLDENPGFDRESYKEYVKEYCLKTMGCIPNNKNNKKETVDMKKTTINGEVCKEIKGYFIPEPTEFQLMKFKSMKMGEMTPKDYLKSINKDPAEYKVTAINEEDVIFEDNKKVKENDGMNNNENGRRESLDQLFKRAAEFIKNKAVENGKFENTITFEEVNEEFPTIIFDKTAAAKTIRQYVAEYDETCGAIFSFETRSFSVRIKGAGERKPFNKFDRPKTNKDETNRGTTYVPYNEGQDKLYNRPGKNLIDKDDDEDQKKFTPKQHKKKSDDVVPFEKTSKDDYVKAYADRHKTTVVEDVEIEKVNAIYSLSQDDIDSCTEEFNGEDCTVIGRYYVPVRLLDKFYDSETGKYEITEKCKKILKKANISPKKYIVGSEESDDVEVVDSNTGDVYMVYAENNELQFEEVSEATESEVERDQAILGRVVNFAKDLADNREGFCEPRFGIISMPIDELALIMLRGYQDDDVVLPNEMDTYASIRDLDDEKVEIYISREQMENLYQYLVDANDLTKFIDDGSSVFSVEYDNNTISIQLDEYKVVKEATNDYDDSEEEENEEMNSVEEDDIVELDGHTTMGYIENSELQFEEVPEEVITTFSDINSYNEDNNEIENENEEDSDLSNEVIEMLNKLVKTVEENTTAIKRELLAMSSKLDNINDHYESEEATNRVYEEMACESRCEEATKTIKFEFYNDTDIVLMPFEEIKNLNIAVLGPDEKLIQMRLFDLLDDKFSNMESNTSATVESVDITN